MDEGVGWRVGADRKLVLGSIAYGGRGARVGGDCYGQFALHCCQFGALPGLKPGVNPADSVSCLIRRDPPKRMMRCGEGAVLNSSAVWRRRG